MAKVKQTDDAALAAQPTIVIPPKRIRTVTIGVVFAIVFASLGVGFAFGRITATPRTGSSFQNGNVPSGGFGGGLGGQGSGVTPTPAP
jgi:hypothetical protein